jgi:hypothetical protein
MVLSNMHLELGKVIKSSLQDYASFFKKLPVHFLSLTIGSNWDGDLPARSPRT